MIHVNTQLDAFVEKCTLRSMIGPDAIKIIKSLEISQARFARIAGLHPNAVTKWAHGTPPSGPAVALLRLLKERPELIKVMEGMR